MPNRNRQRGDYFERCTRAAYEAAGWWVIRSAGSLGVADLVALKAGHYPQLISCKVDGKIPRSQALDLDVVAMQTGAHPILAYRVQPGTVTIDELSRTGRIHLYTLKVPSRPKPVKKAKPEEVDPDQLTIYDALE